MLTQARDTFDADAATWRLTPRTAGVIAVLPIVIAALVAAARLSRSFTGVLFDEGSLLESAQVVLLVVAAVALAGSAAGLVRSGRLAGAALCAAAVVLIVVVTGEELSWGQRATNFHVLADAIRAINYLMLLAAGSLVLLIVAIVLWRRAGHAVERLDGLYVPPVALVPAFAIPFAYRTVRLITDGGRSGPYSEMSELSLYYGIAVLAVLVLRRIAARRSEPT